MSLKQFGLNWNRELLEENINQRADSMIENGLIDEATKYSGNGLR
ncbi:MAG: hypothetical protein M5T52_04800 [Ignavibacteriaceae bacterium]|nr:hypothetical protein [Ignavibacteriaceae bacterium]